MNNFSVKIVAAIGVFALVFTYLGIVAMRPSSTQRQRDAFWLCALVFLAFTALFLFLYVSPFLAIAPLFPLILFARIFMATRPKKRK